MNVDTTNKRNIIMFFSYIGMFFLCVAVVAIIAVIAGSSIVNTNIGSLDRPRASVGYHDHRL